MEFITVTPAIDELTSFTDQFKQLNTKLSTFLSDPSAIPPMAREIVGNVSTVESIAVSNSMRRLSANNISGYATDLANHLGATQREMSMRYKSKAMHYQEAIADADSEVIVHSNMQAEYKAAISGKLQSS